MKQLLLAAFASGGWLGCFVLALLPLLRSALVTYRQNREHRLRLEGELGNPRDAHKDYWRACWTVDSMFPKIRSLLRYARGYFRLMPRLAFDARKRSRKPWLKPLVCGLMVAAMLLLSQAAWADWTYIGYCKNYNAASGTDLAGDVALDVADGDVLVAIVTWNDASKAVTISDGGSNTFTLQAESHKNTLYSVSGYILSATANATATFTFALDSAGTYRGMEILQFRPSAGGVILDATSVAATGSSSTPTSGAITTGGNDELVVGICSLAASRATSATTIAGAASEGEPYNSVYNAHAWYSTFDDFKTSATATATLSGGGADWTCRIISFNIGALPTYRCILSTAEGTGTGSSWTNAFTDIPNTLIRGNTYYVGAGTYATRIIDDAVDGTKVITIKKATVAEHGTETGWDNDYGTGVAEWPVALTSYQAVVLIRTSYVVFDGVTGGGPGSWTSGHGFKLSSDDDGVFVETDNTSADVSNITVSHIDMGSPSPAVAGIGRATYMSGGYAKNGITFDHCYIHDIGDSMCPTYGPSTGITFEYCCFARNATSGESHGAGIELGDVSNVVIRYCWFEDITGTGIIGAYNPGDGDEMDGLYVYGNIFYNTPGFTPPGAWNGVLYNTSTSYAPQTNFYFYNNTIYLPGAPNEICYNTKGSDETHLAYNNIIYALGTTPSYTGYAHDYSASDETITETHFQALVGSPFYSGTDFHLSENTSAGTDLGVTYDEDMDGETRTTWSRGAYEYTGSGPTTYTVTYNDNGSDGGSVPTDTGSPYIQGAEVTVLGNTGSLTKTGYIFDHWNTAADGSGVSYDPNDTFYMPAENTTLYAIYVALGLYARLTLIINDMVVFLGGLAGWVFFIKGLAQFGKNIGGG